MCLSKRYLVVCGGVAFVCVCVYPCLRNIVQCMTWPNTKWCITGDSAHVHPCSSGILPLINNIYHLVILALTSKNKKKTARFHVMPALSREHKCMYKPTLLALKCSILYCNKSFSLSLLQWSQRELVFNWNWLKLHIFPLQILISPQN